MLRAARLNSQTSAVSITRDRSTVSERKYTKKNDRWLAYMLATTHHETDRTNATDRGIGKGKWRTYGVAGHTYYRRGFVQLTWKSNYQSMGKKLKVDLVNRPELALGLKVATRILVQGMMEGTFTGVRLSSYFNPNKDDWMKRAQDHQRYG